MYRKKFYKPTYLKDAVKFVLRITKGDVPYVNVAQISHFSTFSVLDIQLVQHIYFVNIAVRNVNKAFANITNFISPSKFIQ